MADTLRQAISASELTVHQLAEQSTVPEIVISRFLAGKHDIYLATADRLARVLNLHLTVER
jgi:plasmid maintenance system antidote protein VapI